MPITIKSTQLKYKDPSTSQYVSIVAAANGSGSSSIDVQINGTSILSNGTANIPEAGSETYGVLKTGYSTSGLQKDASGYLKIYPATSDNIKAGTEVYRPIVPYHQHESIFYGLAKAAGADMSSSSNAVGTYTDAAKNSICNMIGAVKPSNLWYAQISNSTYTELFGGEFTVTTAEDNTHIKPFARASVTGIPNKQFLHRVTINGSSYILPVKLWFEGNKTYPYIGNLKLFLSDTTGNTYPNSSESFIIIFDYNDGSTIDVLTSTAGTYTIKIERLSWSYTKLPNTLMYGVETAPLHIINNGSSTYDAYSLGVNAVSGETSSSSARGSIVVGFGNISKGQFNIIEGISNSITGNYNYVTGSSIIINGGDNNVYGGGNTINGNANFIGGYMNTLVKDENKNTVINTVLGYHNTVTNNNYNHIIGIYNSSEGYSNHLFGMTNTIKGNYNVICGSNNTLNETTSSYNHILGERNSLEDDTCHNVIAGLYNIVKQYTWGSITLGHHTTNTGSCSTTLGTYNVIDTMDIPYWSSGTSYNVDDIVIKEGSKCTCITANSDSTFDWDKWDSNIHTTEKALIVGNGKNNDNRSNAFSLNWNGTACFAGDIYVNCNNDSTGGTRIPHDIQINGTSIVSNGIATIPIASDATFGVIKTREFTDGFKFDSNNNLQIAGAADTQIKAGTTNYRAITPYVQHYSVFYGLATAAGDTTQSASSNAIGVYTDNAKASIKSMLGINVDDVQINGTSIVSNGIANFPYVDGNGANAGVCRIDSDYGIASNSLGRLYINKATSTQIPLGSAQYRPIVPYNQHESVFYGLAKAAGDTTQSASDNAVGTYTDGAKTAIKTMLDIPTLVSQLTNDSGFLTSVPTMTGATSSADGASGLVPAPTTGDVDKFLAGDGTYKSGGLPMVILSYGNSTWADFEAAYNNNVIVYCRASSNANPKTGSQTRMAFMAYVNNETTPTNVEFQYYRSMSSHSGTQMGDQVFVYKLDKTSGWSVTTREAGLKEIEIDASTGLQATWSNNKLTITTI